MHIFSAIKKQSKENFNELSYTYNNYDEVSKYYILMISVYKWYSVKT